MPAETCSCGAHFEGTSKMLDSFHHAHKICTQVTAVDGPRTLDLIMWSLRLPLLREARVDKSDWTPGIGGCKRNAELKRLDALIAEGERALGILPEVDDE